MISCADVLRCISVFEGLSNCCGTQELGVCSFSSYAFSIAQRLAKEEGILVGISTGAALAAVAKKLPEIPKGSKILTYNYDTGERYLSIEGLFQ